MVPEQRIAVCAGSAASADGTPGQPAIDKRIAVCAGSAASADGTPRQPAIEKRIAVCPGSFDPITEGHLDIIRRASSLFDTVIVLVVINPGKAPSFTHQERVEMIREAVDGMPNVEVDSFQGLLINYVRQRGACAIVKGLRAMSDFEYEFQMALTNKKMLPYAETVFLTTSAQNMYVSSSLVKQVAMFGGDISDFVPRCLLERITRRLGPAKDTQTTLEEKSKGGNAQ